MFLIRQFFKINVFNKVKETRSSQEELEEIFERKAELTFILI